MQHDFSDKLIVITGGASGIGKALVQRFVDAGAHVALLDLQQTAAIAVAEQLSTSTSKVTGHGCDVTDETQVNDTFASLKTVHKRPIYALINNAGISHRSMFTATEPRVLKAVIDVSILGSVYCTHAALADIKSQNGAIAALSSVAGYSPLYGRTGYAAAKHAVQGFFGSLRAELLDEVSITLACPSFVDTPIVQNALSGDGTPVPQKLTRVGKPLSPEAVAEMIFAGMSKGRPLVLAGRTAKLAWQLNRLLPQLYLKQMRKKIKPEFDAE